MTEIQLRRLVNEAVLLHRDIAIRTDRLKTLKADLVREARQHEHEFTPTDKGGTRWTATGNNGCIARVNFPASALVSHIDSESETFDEVLGLAGESLDRLFASVYYLRPVPEFREQAVAALPNADAAKLIELCQTSCAPRVSFETAPTTVVTRNQN
ncbi:MAG: hypothetical protein H0U23_06555 [Blastocatellia bacterium]|nr:hypothetical protein [Blastocatellia bacterium]